MASVLTGATNTTYWVDGGEVVKISRFVPDMWPDHQLTRVLTAAEHGETLMACDLHDAWVGTVIESAEHVAVRP